MNAAVITFPGSNCDDDSVYALQCADFQVDRLWHKKTLDLSGYKLIVVPGGFSYGDYLRCGAIAAHSPIGQEVKKYAAEGGLVIGVCNGFQMLCEMGLLPGALVRNVGAQFVCRNAKLMVQRTDNPWMSAFSLEEKIELPMAHGEGRYVLGEEDFQTLLEHGQILLTYSDPNPNGSEHAIAGICNEKKNVFGLMPHPERATDLQSRDGARVWKSIVQFLEGNS